MYGRHRNGEGIDYQTGEGIVKGYRIGPGADLRGANLEHQDLALANLGWANLAGAFLAGANLQGANLERADLNTSLWGANLVGANLEGADFRGARLKSGANLAYANLTGVYNLERAEMDSRTNFFRATVDPETAEIIYSYTGHSPERLQLKINPPTRTPNPGYGTHRGPRGYRY
jgi:hypothetical protein